MRQMSEETPPVSGVPVRGSPATAMRNSRNACANSEGTGCPASAIVCIVRASSDPAAVARPPANRERILAAMAIEHAHSGQAVDVQPLGRDLSAQKTTALFKSNDLEVIRLVLLAGKSLPPHKVPGEITVQ